MQLHLHFHLCVCFQSTFTHPDIITLLRGVSNNPLPLEYPSQIAFLQSLELKLASLACTDLESMAQVSYENQIFPALLARLQQRQDITIIKRLYRILYDKVRSESVELASTIISWLQPPQAFFQTAFLGMEDEVVTRYSSMMDSIASSRINAQQMLATSNNSVWPRQQAFLATIACDIEEFCELFWRLCTSNTTGITNSHHWICCLRSADIVVDGYGLFRFLFWCGWSSRHIK